MDEKVVLTYSEAFFELSKEKNKLDLHKKDFEDIDNLLNKEKKLSLIMQSPEITKEEKKNIIDKIFGFSDIDIINFLKVLIDKSRFYILEDVIRDFVKKYNNEKGIMQGYAYSANQLSEKDLEDLIKSLEKKFNKKVELKNIIDESIIGGVSILIDGIRIDNSYKYRLENLRAHLMKEGE